MRVYCCACSTSTKLKVLSRWACFGKVYEWHISYYSIIPFFCLNMHCMCDVCVAATTTLMPIHAHAATGSSGTALKLLCVFLLYLLVYDGSSNHPIYTHTLTLAITHTRTRWLCGRLPNTTHTCAPTYIRFTRISFIIHSWWCIAVCVCVHAVRVYIWICTCIRGGTTKCDEYRSCTFMRVCIA